MIKQSQGDLVEGTEERPTKNARQELKDIVFTMEDAMWVDHPRVDALVIIARVVNSNVDRLVVDDGSAINIIYLDADKRMQLTKSELSPITSLLYRFTGDHVIPRGIGKLAATMGSFLEYRQ